MIKKIIAVNRKAKFEYQILDSYEAGIVLLGTEVKAARQHGVTINEAYVGEMEGGLYLFNAHFPEYKFSIEHKHEPKRPRKLLLHRKQLNKLLGNVRTKGLTIIPLQMYFNDKNLIKIEIALCKGKNLIDKRETIKQREWAREKHRILKPS